MTIKDYVIIADIVFKVALLIYVIKVTKEK